MPGFSCENLITSGLVDVYVLTHRGRPGNGLYGIEFWNEWAPPFPSDAVYLICDDSRLQPWNVVDPQ